MSDVVVVKVGTSSVTTSGGDVDVETLNSLARQVAALLGAGQRVVVVTSGAITAGWSAVGRGAPRPNDAQTLQAVSAVGQPLLMDAWRHAFADHGRPVGQVLLAPHDFADRAQYLHARGTIESLWSLGVVPVVNENDAIADEEIRFGDNDRLAALVASLVGASTLILLTDTAGLLTADPRFDPAATLIAEIETLDDEIMALASGSSSGVGSGGMTSKLSAARIAQWSGVTTVIAPARETNVVLRLVSGESGLGTTIAPRRDRLSARKAWIAFAVPTVGRLVINEGAATALTTRGSSLLGIGVLECTVPFLAGQAIDVVDVRGERVAKGVARVSSDACGESDVVVHRDELVVLK
ncbi:MAG: glutamate 5-kinase [Acidobacteria bacterium]|nr:glutamate 5-kinase [Acidobacteriota bacterium]